MAPVDHPGVPLKSTPARGKANSVVGIKWYVGIFHSGDGGKCRQYRFMCKRKVKWRRWRGFKTLRSVHYFVDIFRAAP